MNHPSTSAASKHREGGVERATIHIVDDNPKIRTAVSRLVTEIGFLGIQYENGEDFLDRANFDSPSCVVLDIRMPGMGGLAVQSRLLERKNPPPVIVVSGQADVRTAVEAMQRGAFHLLEKPFRAQELIQVLQRAVRGGRNPSLKHERRAAARQIFADLSFREREVAGLVLEGLSTKEIAERIGISIQAVNGHKRAAMTKLGVDNIPDFVRILDSIDLASH